MVNAVIPSGAFVSATGTSLTTLSVTSTAIGNAFMFTASYINTATLSTVSGGGCTTWTKLVGAFTAYSGSAKIDLWMGVVTSTTTANIVIAGTGLTNTQRLCAQQFTSGGGPGTVWAQDGAGGTKTNTSSTTITFPTLTPTAGARMYMGYGLVGGSATGGSQTAGYTLDLDPGSNPFMFNPGVSAAQTPTCTQSVANLSGAIAALVTVTNPVVAPLTNRARLIRASHW